MTLVRPQVIVAMTDAHPAPRYEMPTVSMQLVVRGGVVWARRAAWLRNVPFTADPYMATLAQLETRIHFGDIAKDARGSHKERGQILPPAALLIQQRMKGYHADERFRMNPAEYPSRNRHTLGGVVPNSIALGAADLRAIMQDKIRRLQAYGGRGAGPGQLGVVREFARATGGA